MLSYCHKLVYVLIILSSFLISAQVFSKGDLSKQPPITVKVNLSNKDNALRFFPENIKFESGKLYRLVLKNAGTEKHYFSSDKFSQSIFTRKIQIVNNKGRALVEVKGNIREIEIYPGEIAEWWFVPIKTGVFDDLKCVITGHAEAGMRGKITVQ